VKRGKIKLLSVIASEQLSSFERQLLLLASYIDKTKIEIEVYYP